MVPGAVMSITRALIDIGEGLVLIGLGVLILVYLFRGQGT
jgi:hypothetical protein